MPVRKLRRSDIIRRRPYTTVSYVPYIYRRFRSGGTYRGYARKLSGYLHNQQRFYSERARYARMGGLNIHTMLNRGGAYRHYFRGVRYMPGLRNYMSRFNPGAGRIYRRLATAGRRATNGGIGAAGAAMTLPPPVPNATKSTSNWGTAIMNPWAALNDNQREPRIPDGTLSKTFIMKQSTSFNIVMPTTTATSGQLQVTGCALRPSMADASIQKILIDGTATDATTDAFLMGGRRSDGSYVWQCSTGLGFWRNNTSDTTRPGYLWRGTTQQQYTPTITNINWGGSVARTLSNIMTTGTNNITAGWGTRCRPTAWGLRVQYAGIAGDTATNMMPAGYIYYGIRNSQHGDTQAAQQTLIQDPNTTLDIDPFFDLGPGTTISQGALESGIQSGTVGRLSMTQLAGLREGLILATGPIGTEEMDFKDIDYYNSIDRWAEQTAATQLDTQYNTFSWANGTPIGTTTAYNPACFDMIGTNPWFLAMDMAGATLKVDALIFWEVIPATQALASIPAAAIAQQPKDAGYMDAVGRTLSTFINNIGTSGIAADVTTAVTKEVGSALMQAGRQAWGSLWGTYQTNN